ncbi:MAG: hypothetical protein ACRCZF_06290, partial [Gemmataceae bacterium]
EYQVAVETEYLTRLSQPPRGITAAPPEKGKAATPPPAASTTTKAVTTPAKYEKFETSGLTVTIVAGQQELPIDCP